MCPLQPLSCLKLPPTTHTLLCSALQAGKFFADEFVGPIMSCSTEAAGEAAVEADVAAAMARALRTEAGATRLRSGQRGVVQSQSRPAGSDGVGAGGSSCGSGRQAQCDVSRGTMQGAASDGAGGLPFGWKLPPSFQWPWQHSQQQRHAVPTSSRATAAEARALGPGSGSSISSSGASAAFTAQAAGVTTKAVADRDRGGGFPGSGMTQQKEAMGGGQGKVGGEDDAEVRPHTRPLNDREMGMVGELVQRLMAAEVASNGEGGGLARRN